MKKLLSLQLGGAGHPTMSSLSRTKSPRETGDRGEGEEETASVAGLGDLDTLPLSRRSSIRTSNVPLTPHGRSEKPCKCCEKGCSVVGRLRQQLQNLREEKMQLEDMISMQTATLHQIDQDGKQLEQRTTERLESQRKLAEILQDERRSTEERLKAATEAVADLQKQLSLTQQRAEEERDALREAVREQTAEATKAAALAAQLETDLELTRRSLLQQTALTAAAAAAQAVEATEGEEAAKQMKLQTRILRLEEEKGVLEATLSEEKKKKMEEERNAWKKQQEEREQEKQEAIEKAIEEARKKMEEEREALKRHRGEMEKQDEREKEKQEAIEKAIEEERKKMEEEREELKRQQDEREKEKQEAIEKAIEEERKKMEEEREELKRQQDEREKEKQEAIEKAIEEARKKMEEEREALKRHRGEMEKKEKQEAIEKAIEEERKKMEEEREELKRQQDEREKEKQEAIEKAIEEARKKMEEEREELKRQQDEREKEKEEAIEKAIEEARKKMEEEREELKRNRAAMEKEKQKAVERVVEEERKKMEKLRQEGEEEQKKRREREREEEERAEKLKRTTEEYEAATKRVTELERLVREEQEKNSMLETTLREKKKEEEALKKEVEEEKRALVKEVERLTTQAAEVADYKEVTEKLKKAHRENGDLELRLGALADEKDAAVREAAVAVEKAQEEVRHLEVELRRKETEIVMFSRSAEWSEEENEETNEETNEEEKSSHPAAVIRRKLRRINRLEEEVKTKEAALQDLEEKLNTLLASQSAATVNLAAKEEELAAVRKRNEQLQRDFDALKEEAEEKPKGVADLEKENAALRERNLMLAQERADEETKAAQLEARLHAAEEALTATREEASARASEKRTQDDEEIQRLSKELAEAQTQLREQRSRAGSEWKVMTLVQTNTELITKLAKVEEDLAAERRTACQQREAHEALMKQRSEQEEKLQTLVATNAQLVSELAAKETEASEAGKQLAVAEAKLLGFQALQTAADKEATEKRELKTSNESLRKKVQEQEAKMNALREAEETARREQREVKEDLEEKKRELAEMRQTHATTVEELAKKKDEVAHANEKAKEVEAALRASLSAAEARVVEKEKRIAEVEAHFREVKGTEKQEQETAVAALQSELASLKTQLPDARTTQVAQAEADENVQQLIAANSALVTELAERETELADVKRQLGKLEAKEATHAEVRPSASADEAMTRLLILNSELTSQLAEQEEEARRCMQTAETLKKENEQLRSAVEELRRRAGEEAARTRRGTLEADDRAEDMRVLLAAEKEKRIQDTLKLKRQLARAEEARALLEGERDEAVAALAAVQRQCVSSFSPPAADNAPDTDLPPTSETQARREDRVGIPRATETDEEHRQTADGEDDSENDRVSRFKREVKSLRDAGADISALEEAWLLRRVCRHPKEAEEAVATLRRDFEMRRKAGATCAPDAWVQSRDPARCGFQAVGEEKKDRVTLTSAEVPFFGGDGLSVLSVLGHSSSEFSALPFPAAPAHAHLGDVLPTSSLRCSDVSAAVPLSTAPLPVSDFFTSVSLYRPDLRAPPSPLCREGTRFTPAHQSPEEAMRNPYPLIEALATTYGERPFLSPACREESSAGLSSACDLDATSSRAPLQPFFAPLPRASPFAARKPRRSDCTRRAGTHGPFESPSRGLDSEANDEKARRVHVGKEDPHAFADERAAQEEREARDQELGPRPDLKDREEPGKQATPEPSEGKKKRGLHGLFSHKEAGRRTSGRNPGGHVAGVVAVNHVKSPGRDWKR
ncbi:UNVERIFIED_CONTAM: trichohyalin, putative [Hammondia hammondi]|eukprot:XP_008884399.1 trichohyalin, putative [Hammondia hammondi]